MPIVKYPGMEWGGTVRLTYKGPGNLVRIYVGLKPGEDDYWNAPRHWWAQLKDPLTGKELIELPTSVEEKVYAFTFTAAFPDDIPENMDVDIFKIIAWEPIDAYIGNESAFKKNLADVNKDDDIYKTPVSIFDISKPESTWF